MSKDQVKWRTDVAKDDFKAAATYLQLIVPPPRAKALQKKLRDANIMSFPAKDVLRASGLAMLGADDPLVQHQLEKINAQEPLSPVLLVRDEQRAVVIVADGFHRICAVASLDPSLPVHCKLV